MRFHQLGGQQCPLNIGGTTQGRGIVRYYSALLLMSRYWSHARVGLCGGVVVTTVSLQPKHSPKRLLLTQVVVIKRLYKTGHHTPLSSISRLLLLVAVEVDITNHPTTSLIANITNSRGVTARRFVGIVRHQGRIAHQDPGVGNFNCPCPDFHIWHGLFICIYLNTML